MDKSSRGPFPHFSEFSNSGWRQRTHERFEEQWRADESRRQREAEEEAQRPYEEYLNEERGRQRRDKKAEEQARAERDRFVLW